MAKPQHSGEAHSIPGTVIFDGTEAQKGYALNKMCYSFNRAENRAAFARDEEAYCRAYGLTAEQREAVRRRDVLALVHGILPPTLGLREPDEAWADVDVVTEPGRRATLATAVTSSYGFGGHNVTLVLGRGDAR